MEKDDEDRRHGVQLRRCSVLTLLAFAFFSFFDGFSLLLVPLMLEKLLYTEAVYPLPDDQFGRVSFTVRDGEIGSVY